MHYFDTIYYDCCACSSNHASSWQHDRISGDSDDQLARVRNNDRIIAEALTQLAVVPGVQIPGQYPVYWLQDRATSNQVQLPPTMQPWSTEVFVDMKSWP